jgi:hypothetical protein
MPELDGVVTRNPGQALGAKIALWTRGEKAAPKSEHKSEPPPPPAAAEAPTFASSFPIKEWASKPLAEAPFEILEDYRVWLEAVLKDGKKAKLHNPAKRALEAVSAEVDRRIEIEQDTQGTKHSADIIAEGLQKIVDERESQPGGSYDEAPGWGMQSPETQP